MGGADRHGFGPNKEAFRNKVSETRRSLEVAVECDSDAFAPDGLDENGVEHIFGRICDQLRLDLFLRKPF